MVNTQYFTFPYIKNLKHNNVFTFIIFASHIEIININELNILLWGMQKLIVSLSHT